MAETPIRNITLSDFRGLAGNRTLPLDAPVVLIHGSNGAGKTSVLSALEMGMTGRIRSLQRQDPRYTAHLPTLGRDFATVRVEVDPSIASSGGPTAPITAGGSRIEGTPALSPEAANFYGERCYLDQASLGRLLELYQHREGKQESALALFVNELLGLEQLDAVRTGLSAANDFRALKKLADRLEDAATQADRADAVLTETTQILTEAKAEVDQARAAARAAARSIDVDPSEPPVGSRGRLVDEESDERLITAIRRAVGDHNLDRERAQLVAVQRDLIALGGRLDAVAASASTRGLREARLELERATRKLGVWDREVAPKIEAWQRAARAADVVLETAPSTDVDRALSEVQRLLHAQPILHGKRTDVLARLDADRLLLESLQKSLVDAQEHATALVEGLASIRPAITGDSCPVCDRDYAELGSGQLGAHVDAKLTQLSQQGRDLLDLRQSRDAVRVAIAQSQSELEAIDAALLEPTRERETKRRAAELARLYKAWQLLLPAEETGRTLRQVEAQARRRVEELETASNEESFARAELTRCATTLGRPIADGETVRATWEALSSAVTIRLDEIAHQADRQRDASWAADQLELGNRRHADAVELVADAAQRKAEWEACVKEGRRRQAVARAVFDAASEVRTSVVERVFTQSLNRVWMNLFSRLAPNEGFIPSFGIPTSSKTGLELTLRTVHREGGEGGSPQMMLSAGNLNTAALSLFLALHLAVDPKIPCLVFDDPVQAMDEVHIAQFAALIRVLAKQHGRQVIIAVHERELFDYLSLELSPAYEGDELLTIELGERSLDRDVEVTRHTWARDAALAS